MATSTRRRAAPAAPDAAPADATELATLPEAPKRRSRSKPAPAPATPEGGTEPAASTTDTPEGTAPVAEAPATATAPARKPRTRKPAPAKPEAAPAAPAVADLSPAEPPADARDTATAEASPTEPAASPAPAKASRAKRPARKKAAAEPVAEVPSAPPPLPATEGGVEALPAAEASPTLDAPVDAPLAPELVEAPTAPEQAAEPAPPAAPEPATATEPQPHAARLGLSSGLRRQPVWQPAHPPVRRVNELVARWQTGRDGALALADADALAQLLGQIERTGEPVEVDPALWTQLALRGDLHRRIDHLSELYPQGLDGVQLPEATHLAPPQPCQLEAAFYAACVGACLIADEPQLQPLREALLAWQLVQRHFGATRLAVSTARPGDWQALLPAGAAAAIQWCAPGEPLAELVVDALILDHREVLGAVVPALPDAPWCWVIAPSEVLSRRERAVAWLSAMDRVGAGALADWVDGAPDEVLAPLMLQRRFADVADQWPAWAPGERAVEHTDDELATLEALHQTMRPVLARWQRSGFLSDTDQLALQRTLRSREHLARAAAIGALAPLLHKALVNGAQRAVVFSADAGFLGPLAELLRAEDLPCHVLPIGPDADAALRAYRDAPGAQVLLVADEIDGPRIATQPHRPVVVALDSAGDEALRQARLARVRTARVQREVPVWQLCAAGVPTLPAAPAHGLLRGEALKTWLQALAAALLPAATPEAPVA